MSENYQPKGYAKLAISAIAKWCFDYLKKECRWGLTQPNMESDSYYYYRQL